MMYKNMILRHRSKIKVSRSDRIFYATINIIVLIAIGIVIIPTLNIIASSFSSPTAVSAGKVGILPQEFTLEGYKMILHNNKLVIGYGNTIFYTVFGTLINILMTTIAAYPLSRKDFMARGTIMKIFTFTMYFGGGMIANYLLYKNLGLINNRLVMLLPGAISVYNMIVMRTFFETNIPAELLESTKMDGCSDFRFLASFAIPLSKSIFAVMILYYAVGHWNAYFNAFLYLSDEKKYPISVLFQQLLGGIVTKGSQAAETATDAADKVNTDNYKDLIQYALIVVTSLPVCCAYPFVQRYFVKGMMTGAVKG